MVYFFASSWVSARERGKKKKNSPNQSIQHITNNIPGPVSEETL
jgi:hypothetical protein